MIYNNFLHEYRSHTCNIANMVSMNDEHATKLFKQYSEYGYILIGTDTEHISEMINILKQGNYSYMPVYARFIKYEDMFHQMFDYERAINPAPACYSERVTRAGTKEIFLSR